MLQPGDVLGGYEIVEQLGAGGMATVYRAYQPRLDRYVAIKVMHQTLSAEENFLARFQREARIIARLDHPHIVPVYDFDEHDGSPYLVMKYVEGETLEDRLRRGPLPLPEVVRIMTAVADALTYAHEHGVLHRDVKPANILIDARGIPYLTDFGLARLAAGGSSTLSQGTIIGTPHYISPEQALGQAELDARTDVYSLGVVLYELVVGRVPFPGDTPFSVVHDHIYAPLPAPREVNPSVSLAVEAVLIRALAKKPDDRYPTPNALLEAFRAALGETPSVPGVGEKTSPARGAKRPAGPGFAETLPPVPPAPVRQPSPPRRVPNDDKPELDDLGDIIEEKVEAWAESIEDWAEQLGERIAGNVGSLAGGEAMRAHRRQPLTEEEKIRRRVERRLKEQADLRIHGVIFLMVNLFLWVVWLLAGGGFPWPVIVTLGWGIGIVAHYMDYQQKYGSGAEHREREIQRELERARRRGELPADESDLRPAKRKNEDLAEYPVRLTDDGELTASLIEEMEDEDSPRRRGRS